MSQPKPKHTPGPWQVSKAGIDRLVYAESEHAFDLAIVRGGGNEAEVEANAILIAAAPEQNEALERVFDSPHEPDKWLQEVRFALQSADGQARRYRPAEQRRDDLRVQRAAPALYKALSAVARACSESCSASEFMEEFEKLEGQIMEALGEAEGSASQ